MTILIFDNEACLLDARVCDAIACAYLISSYLDYLSAFINRGELDQNNKEMIFEAIPMYHSMYNYFDCWRCARKKSPALTREIN